MNNNDMYSREKLAGIKQREMLREAQNARLAPMDLSASLSNRKLAVVVGTLVVLATVIVVALAAGLRLPL